MAFNCSSFNWSLSCNCPFNGCIIKVPVSPAVLLDVLLLFEELKKVVTSINCSLVSLTILSSSSCLFLNDANLSSSDKSLRSGVCSVIYTIVSKGSQEEGKKEQKKSPSNHIPHHRPH